MFSIERPKHIELSDWKEITDFINNYYLFYSITKQRIIYTGAFAEELKRQKPNLIEADVDKKYKALLREIYFSEYVSTLIRLKDLEGLFHKYDASLLNDNQQKEIKAISDGLLDLQRVSQYKSKLREVVNRHLNEIDNNLIDKEDWEKLRELDQKISSILENKEQAEEDRIKFRKLRKRVENQLEVIDRIISDPDYITKIEDYNKIFNTGNLSNLLKIASALKKQKE